MKRKRNYKSLKKWVRVTLLLVIILLFFFAASLIVTSISLVKNNHTEVVSSYSVKQNVDYKVYLYKNSFIEDEYLPKGQGYISDLVKNIVVDYNYQYSNTVSTDLEYEYDMKATIQGEYKMADDSNSTDPRLWIKEYPIGENKKGKLSDSSQLNVNKQVVVDYHFYDDIVSEFRKELKLPITANLIITFNIKVKGEIDGQPLNNTKEIKLTIPLNQQAFKITEDVPKEDIQNLTKVIEDPVTEKINKTNLIIGICSAVITLLFFIIMFNKIFDIHKKSKYQIEKEKYLKEYGDVIIEVVNPITQTDLNIVTVKSLDELVDLEEELRIPIVFYEDPYDEEAEFTIIHDNILYEYILTGDDDDDDDKRV